MLALRVMKKVFPPSILHACWLRFTAESIVADWLASEFCLLSTRTDEIDLRRLDASAAVACPNRSLSAALTLLLSCWHRVSESKSIVMSAGSSGRWFGPRVLTGFLFAASKGRANIDGGWPAV
eukprot:COSAG01_NODE_25_length_37050_cov_211.559119_16_plen_123_part_00